MYYSAQKRSRASSAFAPSAKRARYARRPKRFASKFKRKTTKPSRLYGSKSRYTLTKRISNQINNLAENVFKGTNRTNDAPVAKPGGGTQPISYMFYNAGDGGVGPDFNALNLFTFPQGDAGGDRTGNYMFIKKAHIKCEIQMLADIGLTPEGLRSTTQFRMMIVKANRKFNELGTSPNPSNSLFLSTDNQGFGYANTAASVYENMSQPINKRQWLVYKDTKFTLSPPATESSSGVPGEVTNASNPKYPVKKEFAFDLPVQKKCHFNNVTNVPDNVDTEWLIIIQACPTSYAGPGTVLAPTNYRLNMLGTTSASDL